MAAAPPDNNARAASTAALLAANRAASAALRAATLLMVLRIWRDLGSWRNADMDKAIPQFLRIVSSGQRHTQSLTSAYLQRWGALTDVRLPGTVNIGTIRDVDPVEEYGRPFHDVWRALGNGQSLQDAVKAGEQHLESLVTTDLQLAKTKTAQTTLGDVHKVVGYRRVLEGPSSCGLCIVASTRRYHRSELLPIHPGCDCDVAPIIGADDPGAMVGAGDLAAVHAAVADRFGADSTAARKIQTDSGRIDYRDIIVTHQHGEIGPVLGVRGQDFASPSDLKTTVPTGD